jgi:hypothetical protein
MLLTYREWKSWLSELPWMHKWFILLILLRPLIDAFYFLKEVSPFLSPLYLVGVITPVLASYTIFKLPRPNYSRLDTYFGIYTFLLSISCIALLVSDSISLDALDNILKITLPSFLYFFCRTFLRTKSDLHGILQTFLYSSVIVLLIFAYELLFNPISIQISRGMERFQGTFADTMNYSIYMTGSLIISGYQMFLQHDKISYRKRVMLLLFILTVSVLLLFKIHHTASYFVVSAVLMLLLVHKLRTNIAFGLSAMVMAGGIIYFLGGDAFQQKVLPLIETDIMVYQGEKDDEALFHGRVGRWKKFYDYFSEQGPVVQIMGLPLNMESPFNYIGKGSHNDFVRHNMLIGYAGLFVYLIIIGNLISRVLKYRTGQQFLGLATIGSLLLFSVTTTPLLYPTFMYLVIPVLAMLAIPPAVMNDSE